MVELKINGIRTQVPCDTVGYSNTSNITENKYTFTSHFKKVTNLASRLLGRTHLD